MIMMPIVKIKMVVNIRKKLKNKLIYLKNKKSKASKIK